MKKKTTDNTYSTVIFNTVNKYFFFNDFKNLSSQENETMVTSCILAISFILRKRLLYENLNKLNSTKLILFI